MNGQLERQRMVRGLCATLRPSAVIETGTFRGTTTAFLHHVSGAPVYTVEASPRFYFFAKNRLDGMNQVSLSLGDSRDFLLRLAGDHNVPKSRVLFYLDAHWEEDLPLADELGIIWASWEDPIVLVDDFAVPGDPGYGYDSYGPDRTLDCHYVDRLDLQGVVTLVPSTPSMDESGARRGCAVIVNRAMARDVLASGLLRLPECSD